MSDAPTLKAATPRPPPLRRVPASRSPARLRRVISVGGGNYLGSIQHDPELWRTVRARRPLLVQAPASKATHAFAHIADRLAELDAAAARSKDTP